ncbi:MAG TPA: trypsin-like peptidase domain-containing protein, partial [Pirellulales bacterium]|nr:trypsin-like peptidase domain-containing protein [Pirellulales bacterium]
MRCWTAMLVEMCLAAACLATMPTSWLRADDAPAKKEQEPADKPAADRATDWVARLVAKARPSVVVITVTGRDGTSEGIGTGFIVSPGGLIATNLHVIGEARPIQVRSADGKTYEVTAVEAVERAVDLALLRVRAKNLPALALGD